MGFRNRPVGGGAVAAVPVISATGATSTRKNTGNTSSGGTTHPAQLVLSADIAAGDLLVLTVVTIHVLDFGAGGQFDPRAHTPAGWALLNTADIGTDHLQAHFTKTAVAGDAGSTVSVPWSLDAIGDWALTGRVFRAAAGGNTPVVSAFASVLLTAATTFPTPALAGLGGSATLLASYACQKAFGSTAMTMPGVLGDTDSQGANSFIVWQGAGVLTVNDTAPAMTATDAVAQDSGDAYAIAIQTG